MKSFEALDELRCGDFLEFGGCVNRNAVQVDSRLFAPATRNRDVMPTAVARGRSG